MGARAGAIQHGAKPMYDRAAEMPLVTLTLTKSSEAELPRFTLVVAPTELRRPPGSAAAELRRIDRWYNSAGQGHLLLDLEDVHRAYSQIQRELGLARLDFVTLRQRVERGLATTTTRIQPDGTWAGSLRLA